MSCKQNDVYFEYMIQEVEKALRNIKPIKEI